MIGRLAMIGLGAGLMYLLDPVTGRKRRAALLDQALDASPKIQQSAEKINKDAQHWLAALLSVAQSLVRGIRDGNTDIRVVPSEGNGRQESVLPVDSATARLLTGLAGTALALFGFRLGNRTGISLALLGVGLLSSAMVGRDLTR